MIEMLQFRTNETKLKYSNKKASKSENKKQYNILFKKENIATYRKVQEQR